MAVRQAIDGCEVPKCVSVKTRDPFDAAEPQKASRILFDLINVIAEKSVGYRVGFHGKPFSKDCGEREEKDADSEEERDGRFDGDALKYFWHSVYQGTVQRV